MQKTHLIIVLSVSIFYQITSLKTTDQEYELEFSCDRRMENEMDKAITRLIVVGQRNTKFPTNERELRPYCNLALRTFDLAGVYADKCVPEFGKHTAKVFMYAIGNELKGVCKTGKLSKRARELLKAAPCANAGLKNWQKCNKQIIEKLTGIINAPIKQRIPMGCCNFHQLVHCLTEEAEEVKKCTKKTVDYLTKYAHKLIDPILVILCNEYSEPSDRCDKMVRLTPNRTRAQRKYHSFLRPLINLGLSLANDQEFLDEIEGKLPVIEKSIAKHGNGKST